MAVSSSIGSNIFDVLIGLPLPWLTYSLLNDVTPGYVGVEAPIAIGGPALPFCTAIGCHWLSFLQNDSAASG
jgi:hypothetical protein